MDTDPRGLCLIINNVNFSNNLSTRKGSDVDADKLAELFQSFLLFHVRQERDVTINRLLHILQDIQKKNHSEYCAFALVILSHGDEGGVVYCSDGASITVEQISNYFTADNCPSLRDKPKLFFVQGCRGNEVIKSTSQLSTSVIISTEVLTGSDKNEQLMPSKIAPNILDFVYCYATIDGCTAMRETQKGSWYINELDIAIREFGKIKDVTYILSKVTDRISKYEYEGQVQVSEQRLTLRKTLYFFPM